MQHKKMIVLDLDGTLLNNDGKVSTKSKDYLNKKKEEGNIIVIATGRILQTAIYITDQALFSNYIISNTGALIYNRDNSEVVSKIVMRKEDVKEIIDCLEKYMNHINCIYINDTNYYNIYTRRSFCDAFDVKVIKDLNDFLDNNEEIIHLSISFMDNLVVQLVQEELSNIFTYLDFNIMQDSFSSLQSIEVVDKDVSKYNSISKIAQLENISNDDIIAFGDGLNDVEMLIRCGVGVAMENALDEVKSAADYITLSNNEDGVVVFLELH